MKSIFKTSALLLCAMAVFASCEDDRDNDPVLQEPTTFKLNTPAFSNSTVNLAASNTLHFTWSQPDYGFPVVARYELQFSPKNDFSTSYAQAKADETGTTVPTYSTAGGVKTVCSNDVEANDVATAIMHVTQWSKNEVPAEQDVYVRCASVFNNDTIYSNVVKIQVSPYWINLRDKEPNYWYFIGSCIGDGSWGGNIGKDMIPLYPISGEKYGMTTGDGKFSYTGYFPASLGFKFRHSATDNWAEQIGTSDGALSPVWNDGGSQNFFVPSDGYYTVTCQTGKKELSVVKATSITGTPVEYTSVKLEGDVNVELKPFNTYAGAKNHDWVGMVDITANGSCHFVTNDGTKFGSSDFTHGTAAKNGKDIKVKVGKYQVWFNDLTGQYNFIYQE